MIAYIAIPAFINIFQEEQFGKYKYFYGNTDRYRFANDYYDSQRNNDRRIRRASIEKPVIENNLLRLFIRYDVDYNDTLDELCPDFKSGNRKEWGITISVNNTPIGNADSLSTAEVALSCLSELYSVSIDTISLKNLEYMFYTHPNKSEKGIISYIDISNLSEGKHILKINRKKKKTNKNIISTVKYIEIPFWKLI